MENRTTIVTALFDLKQRHHRPIETYLTWFGQVLTLRVPMVIYVEPQYVDFVRSTRDDQLAYTKVVATSLSTLETSKLNRRIQHILAHASFKQGRSRPDRPEVNISLYNVICFNKINWLFQEAHSNNFGQQYFLWLDAGYGHGGPLIQHYAGSIWPAPLKEPALNDDRLHLLQIRPFPGNLYENEGSRYHEHSIYQAGGCFGGTAQAIAHVHKKYSVILEDTLSQGLIDDDQAVMTSVYAEHPHLFHNVGPTYGNYFEMLNYLGTKQRVRRSLKGLLQYHSRRLLKQTRKRMFPVPVPTSLDFCRSFSLK